MTQELIGEAPVEREMRFVEWNDFTLPHGKRVIVENVQPRTRITEELLQRAIADKTWPWLSIDGPFEGYGDVLTIDVDNGRWVYVIDWQSRDDHGTYEIRWPD